MDNSYMREKWNFDWNISIAGKFVATNDPVIWFFPILIGAHSQTEVSGRRVVLPQLSSIHDGAVSMRDLDVMLPWSLCWNAPKVQKVTGNHQERTPPRRKRLAPYTCMGLCIYMYGLTWLHVNTEWPVIRWDHCCWAIKNYTRKLLFDHNNVIREFL